MSEQQNTPQPQPAPAGGPTPFGWVRAVITFFLVMISFIPGCIVVLGTIVSAFWEFSLGDMLTFLLIALPFLGLSIAAICLIQRPRRTLWGKLGTAAAVIAALAIPVAVMIPVIGSAIDESPQTQCMTNVKIIGGALRQYETMNGRPPGNLLELAKAGLAREECFKCNRDEEWQPGHSSYFYFCDSSSAPNALALCDLQPRHKGRRSVAYRFGHVDQMVEEDFQKALARPENAAFAAALRAFEASGAKHFPLDRPLAASRPCGNTAPMADRTRDKE